MAYFQKDRAGKFRFFYRPKPGGRPVRFPGKVVTDEAEAVAFVAWLKSVKEKRGPELVRTEGGKALTEFLAARQIADGTRDFYARKMRPFVDAQGTKEMAEWEPRHLEGWIRSHPGWSASTAKATIAAFRQFVKWCGKRGYECADFAGPVEMPRQEPKERRPRSLEEAAAVLAYAEAHDHYLLLPIALARYAGLSYADMVDITWDQVDFDAGLLNRRRHKTGHGKPIPLAPELRRLLLANRAVAGPVCRGLHARKEQPGGNNDTANLHALERRAGVVVEKGDGFHSFRHAFGTAVAQAPGVTLADIRDAMQHSPTSKETLRYLHSTPERTRAAIEHAARATGAP